MHGFWRGNWRKGLFALAAALATVFGGASFLAAERVKTLEALYGAPPRDDARTLLWHRRGAEAGNPQAMANLAMMLERGWGGAGQSLEAAEIWWGRAIEAGHAGAMGKRGFDRLAQAAEGSAEAAEGIAWIERAAEQGDRWSILFIGGLHERGHGGEPLDWAEAARWYQKGIDRRLGMASVRLASLYERGGPGLPRDLVKARRLYEEIARLPPHVSGRKMAREGLERLREAARPALAPP